MCEKIIIGEELICKECNKGLERVISPVCLKCGKPVESQEQEYCKDCDKISKTYEKGFPVFLYNDKMKKSITRFKYNNKREYAKFYGCEIVRTYGKQIKDLQIEVIIPVPVHKSRLRKRGFNQAELIGKEVAKGLGIECRTDLVFRTKKTVAQKELNDKQRIKNLKKAFNIGENEVQFKKVLLIDDIYTSGATIEAITWILMTNGVEKVYYTSVCIGKGQ